MSVPPGASYLASNTYLKLERHLNLEAPVQIQFKEEWKEGNPLYDWYQRRSSRFISRIQLRKELNAPFFHEYVIFELAEPAEQGARSYFRIDRRQCSDETVPVDSIYRDGVEAYDTIEEATSIEDSPYSPSECLIEIDTAILDSAGPRIPLELVLKTIWGIHSHPVARLYTFQRYNCYFFAQTILWCAGRSILKSWEDQMVPLSPADINRTLDWSVAYPIVEEEAIHGRDDHRINRRALTNTTNATKLDNDTDGPAPPGVLPRTLCHLFQEIESRDHGLRTACISHYNSCSVCRGVRSPFSATGMTFNASGRIRASGQSTRHKIPPTNTLQHRFRASLIEFWKKALGSAGESQYIQQVVYSARDLQKVDASHTHVGPCSNKCRHDFKIEMVSEALSMLLPPNGATRSLWSECVRKALKDFGNDLNPMIQRALECPTWEPSLTPEFNAENLSALKDVEDWTGNMATFTDSEYDRLESALKAEMIRFCAQALPPDEIANLPTLDFSHSNPRLEAARELKVFGKLDQSLINGMSWSRLERCLDNLTRAHCDRVEQYELLPKCASDDLVMDIVGVRSQIWAGIPYGLRSPTEGLRIDPVEFSQAMGKLSIPTPFTNPFDGPSADPGQLDYASPERGRRLGPRPPRPADTTPERSTNITRKRGRWSPESKASASSVLDLTSTASAYIDSPARYVDFGEERAEPEEEINEIRAPKRRRIAELADSVISTAFSAAVIGTAVGLTAYRLWRDRGKDGLPNPEPSTDSLPPPPPYTPRAESEDPAIAGPSYIPVGYSAPSTLKFKGNMNSTPIPTATPRRRANTTRRQQGHTGTARRRRPINPGFARNQSPVSSLRRSTAYYTAPDSSRSTPAPLPIPGSSGPPSHHGHQHSPKPDAPSGDELDDADMEMSGQMDWMSSQLQSLINEGKRALGTEVVVGGADEVDDGAEGWTSADEEGKPASTHSRTQSRATTRPALARSTSRASKPRQSTSSTCHTRSASASGSSSVKKGEGDGYGIEVLYQSPLRSDPSARGGPTINDDGESDELRNAMERVRKAYGLR